MARESVDWLRCGKDRPIDRPKSSRLDGTMGLDGWMCLGGRQLVKLPNSQDQTTVLSVGGAYILISGGVMVKYLESSASFRFCINYLNRMLGITPATFSEQPLVLPASMFLQETGNCQHPPHPERSIHTTNTAGTFHS